MLEVQLVNPPHDRKLGRRHRARLVIHAAAAQPQQLRLPHQRQRVPAVDHRFALSSPALPSAPDKKSFSSVSSPIMACNVSTSPAGAVATPEAPNTSAAPPTSCDFQAVIWFGCTSNCCAKSASVFSPLRAANATFALKTGLWVRRIRFVMLAPDPRHHRRFQADPPLIALSEFGRPPLADYAGTGNTLNANHPVVRRMIVDSLRYWVEVMHVDGFWFDLASILSRDEQGRPMPAPPVLWDIETDPVLAGTKLIAEAWDAAG